MYTGNFILLTATFPTTRTDFQCQEIQKASFTGKMHQNFNYNSSILPILWKVLLSLVETGEENKQDLKNVCKFSWLASK